MVEFFPAGFWKGVATVGMVLFFVLGLDLLFGARLLVFLSRTMNRKFQFDQIIVKVLTALKDRSDKEFDVDRPMLTGWGRFVVSGVLFFGAVMIMMNLMPRL